MRVSGIGFMGLRFRVEGEGELMSIAALANRPARCCTTHRARAAAAAAQHGAKGPAGRVATDSPSTHTLHPPGAGGRTWPVVSPAAGSPHRPPKTASWAGGDACDSKKCKKKKVIYFGLWPTQSLGRDDRLGNGVCWRDREMRCVRAMHVCVLWHGSPG